MSSANQPESENATPAGAGRLPLTVALKVFFLGTIVMVLAFIFLSQLRSGASRQRHAYVEFSKDNPSRSAVVPKDLIIVPEPRRPTVTLADLQSATDFEFVLGEGTAADGYELIRFDQQGRCRYCFKDPVNQSWKQAGFRLDAETVAFFRELLIETDIFALQREYRSKQGDGQEWFLKVRCGRFQKSVYCVNYCVGPVEVWSSWAHLLLLNEREQEIQRAMPVAYEKVREAPHFED